MSNNKVISKVNQNLKEDEMCYKKILIPFIMRKKWFLKLSKC